jgi:hypothetical protein
MAAHCPAHKASTPAAGPSVRQHPQGSQPAAGTKLPVTEPRYTIDQAGCVRTIRGDLIVTALSPIDKLRAEETKELVHVLFANRMTARERTGSLMTSSVIEDSIDAMGRCRVVSGGE